MTPMSLTQFHSVAVDCLRRQLESAGPGGTFDVGRYAAEAGLGPTYAILEIEALEKRGHARSVADNSLEIWLTPEGILWLEAAAGSQSAAPEPASIKQATGSPGAGKRALELAQTKAESIEADTIDKISSEKAAVLARHGRSGMLHGTPTVLAIHDVILTGFKEALGQLSETYLAARDAGEASDAIGSGFTDRAAKLREVVWNMAIDVAQKYSPGSEALTGRLDLQLRSAEESAKADFGLAMARRLRDEASAPAPRPPTSAQASPQGPRVFVVHGRDEEMKHAVARALEQLKLKPLILHEQPNRGRTLIEKFMDYSDVGFAVVLLSPDDLAYPGYAKPTEARPRARQNVILELGYFLGKLGRDRVAALHRQEPGFEMPSDYAGVVFTPFDDAGAWRLKLVKELQAANYDVDANALSG